MQPSANDSVLRLSIRQVILKRHLLFGIGSIALFAANVGVLRALAELGSDNPTASHHILVPFVTVALIYRNRESILAAVQTDGVIGAGVAAIGLAVLWAGLSASPGAGQETLGYRVAALGLLWVAAFLVCYGRRAFRAALFPLLFLAFMVPPPAWIIDSATAFLKTGSSEAVAGLFTITGTPYHRDGFVFSLPQFVIEIADECSGIRSSIALLLTTLLAGHMFLTTGWKKALLATIVLPFAILKNGIRIVALSLLAIHVDPRFLTGALHHEGGFVFFLVALVLLFPLFAVLHRSDLKRATSAKRT